MKNATLLIIDDDPDVLTAFRLLLKREVKNIIADKNPENIPSILSKEKVDMVLLDMNFRSSVNTGNEGLFWLNRIKTINPALPVVMITAYGAIDLAVASLKKGATDFIVKPWQNEQMLEVVDGILSEKVPKKRKEAEPATNELLGESEVMQSLFYKIRKIAPTDANILILGENGTGKDLIAAEIHRLSHRSNEPYVKVDVGALTDTLFESELFGHKRGAFTDAREDRTGRFEVANKGTIFLDEIGNISLVQQAKLLSVLQNRTVTKLGSNESKYVDIRLLCATNVPLSVLADESRFRKDLIYRINTVEVQVPPLRNRQSDITLLSNHFARIYAKKYLKPEPEFDKKALTKLKEYPFPGNVRELQYSIERAIIMADSHVLTEQDIIFSPIELQSAIDLKEHDNNLLELEKNTILKVLEQYNGNISKAARELGITRTALYRRLDKYNI